MQAVVSFRVTCGWVYSGHSHLTILYCKVFVGINYLWVKYLAVFHRPERFKHPENDSFVGQLDFNTPGACMSDCRVGQAYNSDERFVRTVSFPYVDLSTCTHGTFPWDEIYVPCLNMDRYKPKYDTTRLLFLFLVVKLNHLGLRSYLQSLFRPVFTNDNGLFIPRSHCVAT